VFYSEKNHLFSKFKRILKKTLGRGPTGEEGVEGIYKKVPFCHPSADEDEQNPNIWGMIS
jgi:hypothetical protein